MLLPLALSVHFNNALRQLIDISYACLVASGGRLMEHFLTAYAGYTTMRIWRNVVRQWIQALPYARTAEKNVQSSKVAFYYYLLNGLACRGNSVTRQLFFTTLLLVHKGLSRSGIEATGHMNLTLSPRTYDAHLKMHLQRQATQLR